MERRRRRHAVHYLVQVPLMARPGIASPAAHFGIAGRPSAKNAYPTTRVTPTPQRYCPFRRAESGRRASDDPRRSADAERTATMSSNWTNRSPYRTRRSRGSPSSMKGVASANATAFFSRDRDRLCRLCFRAVRRDLLAGICESPTLRRPDRLGRLCHERLGCGVRPRPPVTRENCRDNRPIQHCWNGGDETHDIR